MSKKFDLAIYSTYCGTTDNSTFKKNYVKGKYDYFFISNNTTILNTAKKYGWTPIFFDEKIFDDKLISAYQAKKAKALPHKFNELKNYDYTFYIDDKGIPNTSKIENTIIELNNSKGSLGIRAHPWLKNNNLLEFAEAMLQPRYRVECNKTADYINFAIKEGYVLKSQMYWTSAILRNMKHEDTISLNELWYEHINKCGPNCQISFNFISQKFSSIVLLPQDITD